MIAGCWTSLPKASRTMPKVEGKADGSFRCALCPCFGRCGVRREIEPGRGGAATGRFRGHVRRQQGSKRAPAESFHLCTEKSRDPGQDQHPDRLRAPGAKF